MCSFSCSLRVKLMLTSIISCFSFYQQTSNNFNGANMMNSTQVYETYPSYSAVQMTSLNGQVNNRKYWRSTTSWADWMRWTNGLLIEVIFSHKQLMHCMLRWTDIGNVMILANKTIDNKQLLGAMVTYFGNPSQYITLPRGDSRSSSSRQPLNRLLWYIHLLSFACILIKKKELLIFG